MPESVTYVPGMKCYPSIRKGNLPTSEGIRLALETL
jgi:hypothetical protein